MNTKTDGISSGLVVHIAAFEEALHGTRGDLDAWLECNNEAEVRQAIFGVLSDAEAIIAQKDAEIIEQCRLNGMGAEREATLLGKVERQSAALKLAKEVLEDAHRNINPERGYADEIESDIEKTIAAINEVLGE